MERAVKNDHKLDGSHVFSNSSGALKSKIIFTGVQDAGWAKLPLKALDENLFPCFSQGLQQHFLACGPFLQLQSHGTVSFFSCHMAFFHRQTSLCLS